MAATTAPTCSGSSRASGACRSTHSYTLTCLPSQAREHASLGGAPHLRRGHAGGAGRLLERGRRAHLVLTGLVERHLHRPAAVGGVQPPHKSLLAPRDRPVRQPRRPAKAEAPGELGGIHQATPAHMRAQYQDRRSTFVSSSTGSTPPSRALFSRSQNLRLACHVRRPRRPVLPALMRRRPDPARADDAANAGPPLTFATAAVPVSCDGYLPSCGQMSYPVVRAHSSRALRKWMITDIRGDGEQ